MKTQIVSADDLEEAIHFLKSGVPIAIPTETVYGLAASIHLSCSIEEIFLIKGRPSDNPLIVHVGKMEDAHRLGSDLPPSFFTLTEQFWPGPLTLVVKKSALVPPQIARGLPSVALRFPAHPVARRLLEEVGPLAAPSANLSGKPSPTTAFDVLEDLEGKIPLIVDGGSCAIGIESTVVSLLGSKPVMLRPGILKQEELEEALKERFGEVDEQGIVLSPGMKYRHYAPKAQVRLIFEKSDLKGPYILSPAPTEGMRLVNEKTLYGELRRADRCGMKEIEIDCSGSLCHNVALMDRLRRTLK